MPHRIYNFSAGPAMLPTEVLNQAQAELLNWQHSGMSVMEISHRSAAFIELAFDLKKRLRRCLNVPDNYEILFLQGGAQSQFAMVPLNLLGEKKKANYLLTGLWSNLAAKEATRYADIHQVAGFADQFTKTIPPSSDWQIDPEGAYLHYVDNETIQGLEFQAVPEVEGMPLVCDMSSNLLSRSVEVSKFGLIYACAQKNIGQAGVTLVLIRKDLFGKALPHTPTIWNYGVQARYDSMYNTPPTYAWYIAWLCLKWFEEEGGILEFEKRSLKKSGMLYDFIDKSDFYINTIEPLYRSRTNVTFSLKNKKLEPVFLEKSAKAGLANLRGHKKLGGMRASLYNAMPQEGVLRLIEFMMDFEKNNK